MDLNERIKAFSGLGEILMDALENKQSQYSSRLLQLIDTQHIKNPWFTPDNVRMAVRANAVQLTQENLVEWTSHYPELNKERKPMKVAVIMAGNIPMVGFHDFLTVLISGNDLIAKRSTKDSDLIRFAGEILTDLNKDFKNKIEFTEDTVSGFDAVIATGSDNTSRYFEYYFGKYPNIIRKNRNSIAVIDGNEDKDELSALGTDVFSYFGLGCRNVSKLYFPEGYDFSMMINSWSRFSGLINHSKYANNYDFNKAVYLVNKDHFRDTGFVLLREETGLSSPVAVLHFQYYKSMEQVKKEIEILKNKLQCIVGHGFIQFGEAQSPNLCDYADGVDTLDFLLKKNYAGIL